MYFATHRCLAFRLFVLLLLLSSLGTAMAAAGDDAVLQDRLPQLFSPLPVGATVAFKGILAPPEEKSRAEFVTLRLDPRLMELARKHKISVLERTTLKLILDEWALNDISDSKVDSGARNLLGADYLITGQMRKQGKRYYCTLKTLDLQNGKIVSFCSGWLGPALLPDQQSLPAPVSPAMAARKQAAANRGTSAEGDLQLWTDKERYAIGDTMTIYFTVNKPYYVQIIDVDPAGKISTVFPNPYQPDALCYPGTTYQVPPRNAPFELKLTPPTGVDRLKAIASPTPIATRVSSKTRGISFTRKIIQAAPTRTQLTFTIEGALKN